MDTPIYIFEANTFTDTLITVTFTLLSIGLILAIFYLSKKEFSYAAKKRKGMYNMLLFTAFLLTSATAILNGWNSLRLKPVKIYTTKIELPEVTVPFQNIQNAYIYIYRPTTIATPPPDSLMNYDKSLFIEEFDRKKPMHILSEENYPIEEILEKLKAEMK